MLLMRKLSYQDKLPSHSLPEIYERFNQALVRQKGRSQTRFLDRKLTAEAMLNAVVLHYLDLPAEQQGSILATYIPRLEALLRTELDESSDTPAAQGELEPPTDAGQGAV